MGFFIAAIFWLILCFIIGGLGKNKNVGFAGAFFISFFFSPLIGLIVVLASSPISRASPVSQDIIKYANSGDTKLRNNDYDGALYDFKEILSITNKAPKSHFKLAYIYSIKENKELAFKHLQIAIEQGFNELFKIKKHDGFKFLREQPEFEEFVNNGYKLTTVNASVSNTLEQLERLAKLKKEGVLTEEEFIQEKNKIINK